MCIAFPSCVCGQRSYVSSALVALQSIPGRARRTPINRKIIEENREVGRSEKGACWVYPVDMLAIMEVQEMVAQVRVPGASSEETTGFTLVIGGKHDCQAIGSQGAVSA